VNRDADNAAAHPPSSSAAVRWHRWLVLSAYLAVLAGGLAYRAQLARPADLVLWDLQDTLRVVQWLGHLVRAAGGDLLLFLPLGLLLGWGLPLPDRRGAAGRLAWSAAAALTALGLCALARWLAAGLPLSAPGSARLVFPAIGGWVGCWLGAGWQRGPGVLVRRAAGLGLIAAGLAAAAALTIGWNLDPQPLVDQPAPVHSEDKRRLVQLLRDNDPRDVATGVVHTVTLSERDLNQLLAWGFSVGATGHAAELQVDQERIALQLSLCLPWLLGDERYLNVAATGAAGVEFGQPRAEVQTMRLGRAGLPRWLLSALSRWLLDAAQRHRYFRPIFAAVDRLDLEPGRVRVAYRTLVVPDGYASGVLSDLSGTRQLGRAVEPYVARLIGLAGQQQEGPLSFGRCLEVVFDEARRRSLGGDPVRENQAAILAIGLMVGHDRVATLAGPLSPFVPGEVTEPFRRLPLRGRTDWTRHFAVSAALEVFSNVATSDMVGLLKEEMDAGEGGSGFSFADLLADRAGVRFAARATRDPQSARAMQDRLAAGFRPDEFLPPAADLPEGLSDAELSRQFGGVGGAAYQHVLDVIERRLDACPAYADKAP